MSEFTRSDYLRIKWPFIALLGSIALGVSIFAGLRLVDQRAAAELRTAREDFNDAEERVEKIALEEATIRANMGEYQLIETGGAVRNEDRLQMDEYFARLRSEFNLFPINVSKSSQRSLLLEYGELDGERVQEPGRPISLGISDVGFSLPLVHENDLAELLDGLLAQPELLQPRSCLLTANGGDNPNYLRLGQHFNATCLLEWYHFRIDETEADGERERR